MTAAVDEAKHLDSVTDHVQEQELDASKANEAVSALAGGRATNDADDAPDAAVAARVQLSESDVALLTSELECSKEVAERALREATTALGKERSDADALAAALRALVAT